MLGRKYADLACYSAIEVETETRVRLPKRNHVRVIARELSETIGESLVQPNSSLILRGRPRLPLWTLVFVEEVLAYNSA